MRRSLLAVLVVLVLAAAAGAAYWQFVMVPARQNAAADGGEQGGPVPVEARKVRVGVAETSTEAVGTLVSNESVVLRPEVAGRITTINFAEGGPVRRGAVLLELDSSVERAELAQAEAQRDLARSNFERARELRRNNVGTQRALDEAEATLRTAEAQVALARAQLDKRTLVAPFDARAGLRNVSIGAFVAAGTDIVNLEQIDPLKVDFRLPEIFLPAVAPGQKIALAIDAWPNETFTGTVKALDPLIDRAGRAILVRAEIENQEGKLRPGLFARVQLTLAERQDALFVPEQAVQPQGRRHFVFKVVDGDNGSKVARLTEVRLGTRRQGEVEIEDGLAAGEVVVTAGLLKIRDGDPVQILPLPASPPPPANGSGAPTAEDGRPAVVRATAG